MMSYNLEEAIDTPPLLIEDIPANFEGFQRNFQLCQKESSQGPGNISSDKSKANNVTEAKMESIFSRWTDRDSIQSFMHAISTLKEQQEFKQQQQKREMYDKFRQIMQQGQQHAKQQQQQQYANTLDNPMPTSNQNYGTTTFSNDSTPRLLSNEPKPSITTQANKKPKVRKVMKGGVLVTMPINTRQPPGRMAVEQLPRGEHGPFTINDKRVVFGHGNILDDILARTVNNKVKSIQARKKTVDIKIQGKEAPCNKTGESANTHEIRTGVSSKNVAINNSKNTSVNLSSTMSLPYQDQHKLLNNESEISQSKTSKSDGKKDIKKMEINASPCLDIVSSDSSQLNEPQVNSELNKLSNLQQVKVVSNIQSSESGQVQKPIVISEGQNSTKACELNSKLDNAPLKSPDNCSQTLSHMNFRVETDGQSNEEKSNVSKPVIDTESYENSHVNTPDSSNKGSIDQDSKTDTEMLSPGGDLVIDVDSDCELNITRPQRAVKKLRYSSLTSESSNSESEQHCSVFDRIISLCVDQNTNKSVEQNNIRETDKGNMQPNTTEAGGNSKNLPKDKKELTSLPSVQNITGEDGGISADKKIKRKSYEEKQGASEKKDTKVNQKKRKKSGKDHCQMKTERRKRFKQIEKESCLGDRRLRYKGRITRSMSLGNADLSQSKINQNRRRLLERPKETVVRHDFEEKKAPSLLSMVSDEALDVTVAQQELSDQRKKKRGGKKKRKKPTEWFLRQKRKEKEMLERRQSQHEAPREPPTCANFRYGKCPKGSTCQFKHEKIKELCGYYASTSKICEKYQDGMCPKMHDEFPCMFFHKRECTNGNTCKFSHAPLTDETREILEKHIAAFEERKQSSTTEPASGNTQTPAAAVIKPTQERKESIFSSTYLTAATNVNSGPPQETASSNVGYCGLNFIPTAQKIRKPVIENPKVKRLCSLSTYKAQPLSSLISTIKSVHSHEAEKDSDKTENAPSTRTSFLPGMFKER